MPSGNPCRMTAKPFGTETAATIHSSGLPHLRRLGVPAVVQAG